MMPFAPVSPTNLSSRVPDPGKCAALIESSGTADFAQILLEMASDIAAVEEVFAWHSRAGCHPEALAAASWLDDQRKRVDDYAGRFFRSDPLVENKGPDGFFLYVIAAQEISFAEYRQICFNRPLFDHKISFVRRDAENVIALNFYLKRGAADPDDAIAGLTFLANIAITSLLRQTHPDDTGAALRRIEGRLHKKFAELSRMECAVLARLALAMPPRNIAGSLDIKVASVKTYRARALAKLGQTDLASTLAQVVV
jgi:hypothetical protein